MSFCLSLLQGFPAGHPTLQPPVPVTPGKAEISDTQELCGPWGHVQPPVCAVLELPPP